MKESETEYKVYENMFESIKPKNQKRLLLTKNN